MPIELPEEKWLPIPGFPGYEVSDQGRVRSYWNGFGAGTRGLQEKPRRVLVPFLNHNGYFRVNLWKDGRRHSRKIHRLVLVSFVGPPPERTEARHLDGNRQNNFLINLQWGTRKQNCADRRRHGTLQSGISKGIVTRQKKKLSVDYPQQELIKLFSTDLLSVSQSTLRKRLKNTLETFL